MRFPSCAVLFLILAACSAPPEPREVSIAGLRNGIEYGDLLFAGQPDKGALSSLKVSGYRTVVNTRGIVEVNWDEKGYVEELGMTYHAIPMGKPLTEIKPEWVEALDHILLTAERPILLHCGSGNRVSGLWAVWQVQHNGLSAEEAVELAASVGLTSLRPLVEATLGVSADR